MVLSIAITLRVGGWLALGILVGLTGCRPSTSSAPVHLDQSRLDGGAALEEARALTAIRPRDAGTPGAQKAAEHLLARLQAMGIQASIDAFEDPCPGGLATFRNVIGVIPAKTDKDGPSWIMLGSHYDTKPGVGESFQGANDSASSTGLLLELARVLHSSGPLSLNILIAFFDGEECRRQYGPRDGLHGSRRLATTLQNDRRWLSVHAVIILDMVGDRNLTVTIPRNGTPQLMSAVFRAAAAEGVRDKFSLYPAELVDDHQPFLEAGMPAVDVIDFEYGSVPGKNDYWHTVEDTLDKLSADSLAIVGRVVIRVLNDLADECAADVAEDHQ